MWSPKYKLKSFSAEFFFYIFLHFFYTLTSEQSLIHMHKYNSVYLNTSEEILLLFYCAIKPVVTLQILQQNSTKHLFIKYNTLFENSIKSIYLLRCLCVSNNKIYLQHYVF